LKYVSSILHKSEYHSGSISD